MQLKFWRKPHSLAYMFLVTLYLLAAFLRKEEGFLFNEFYRIIALGLGFGVPHLIGSLAWQGKPRIENVLITFFILLLLADPQTSWVGMLILGLFTALAKTLLRLEHQPLFNPAAVGLLLASKFGVLTTWWGVSFAPRLPIANISIAALLTIPVGLYLVFLYKKIPTLISAPLSLMAVYFILTGRLPLVTIVEGTFAFFLLIMATEPKTTPLIDWQEWIYGLSLGALLAWLFVHRIAGEPYLVALLLTNFVFGVFKWAQLKLALISK